MMIGGRGEVADVIVAAVDAAALLVAVRLPEWVESSDGLWAAAAVGVAAGLCCEIAVDVEATVDEGLEYAVGEAESVAAMVALLAGVAILEVEGPREEVGLCVVVATFV